MFKRISDILNAPYSLTYEAGSIFKESFVLGLIVSLILSISLPDDNSIEKSDILKILSFGIVTFLISYITTFSLSRIYAKKINDNSWTVKKEIISVISLLILISFGNSVLFFLFGYSRFNSELVLGSAFNTLKIGIFPVIIGIFIEQNRRLKKNLEYANQINDELKRYIKSTPENNIITVFDESEKKALEIKAAELYFIKSAGNYVEFYIKKNESLKPILFRSSLKKVQSQIVNFDFIIQCHRTHLVNILMISSVEGNAQGYKLHMIDCEYEIPVSRSYTKELKKRINKMHFT